MFATSLRKDTNMVIFDSIDDPEGEYGEFPGVPAPVGAAPAPPEPAPAPAPPEPAPAPAVLAPDQADIILARVHGIDEDVHAFVRDVQVGEEILVVNPILNYAEDGTDEEGVLDDVDDGIDEDHGGLEDVVANADVQVWQVRLQRTPLVNPTSVSAVSITPSGQLETASDQKIHILDQIGSTPGIDTEFTATIGSFELAPPEPVNTVTSTTTLPTVMSTSERLLKPALEVVNRSQTAMRLDVKSMEEPAQKPASTLNQAGLALSALEGPAGDINFLTFGNIAKEGFEDVPAPMDEAPAQLPADPAISAATLAPAPLQEHASGSGIVLAQVYGIDKEGLKDDHDLKDVKVGGDLLVMNPTLQGITPEQVQVSVDVQVMLDQAATAILEQLNCNTGKIKYTATVAAFAPSAVAPSTATSQPANADISPSRARLAEPALEAITPATVLEKDEGDVEEPARKRQAKERNPESTFNLQAEPSASDNSL